MGEGGCIDTMFEVPHDYMIKPTAAASWPHTRCPSRCVSEQSQSPYQEGEFDLRHMHMRNKNEEGDKVSFLQVCKQAALSKKGGMPSTL